MTHPLRREAARDSLVALVALAAAVLAGACRLPAATTGPGASAAASAPAAPETDPKKGEVRLAARGGWDAYLLLDTGPVGIWTVEPVDVFPQYAVPEVVALDERGRAWVLVSYSGKWTPLERVHDGKWLGALAHIDFDPRVAGSELYVGGLGGNLYQMVAHPHGALDARLVAHFPGREIHALAGGFLDGAEGADLFVFTRPGGLYRVKLNLRTGEFTTELVEELDGRVRQTLLVPPRGEPARGLFTVSRSGRLERVRLDGGAPRREVVHEEPVGVGRVATRPGSDGRLLYSALDDGRVLRHERGTDGWSTETIYAGPQGARGVAAGRFDSDPERETVAIFGYSGRVELLSRGEEGWSVETLFVDRDRGHWLATAELDGRNATDELLLSGYGGRVVLLARPPGYGSAVLTSP